MKRLDIHSDFDAFEDYFERFEIWAMTKEDDENVNIVDFLTFIGKEAYNILKTVALPENSILLPYTALKELMQRYVKYTNFECGKGRFRKMIHEDIKTPVHTQSYSDNSLRSCDAVHENGHMFDQCLSSGRFHSFNSCKFRNYKCFKCGDIGHIQSLCNATVHLAATNIKSCNSDSIKLSIYNDHLSLSTISKDSVKSCGSPELNETQNSCETVSNQSNYQISDVIVPNMVFLNDSLISEEIPCKSEENMLNEPKESNIICTRNVFVACGKLVHARVLNYLDFDYNSDDFISTAVYPYHEVTSDVYSNQCEKYMLNEATSFIASGYEDSTLFRGEV
ncbi:unnamed protein product [Schistosoma curassoni]|uniref:CCHC-type domain-containing protein n=1 Tax=Schistosoma curassoni TaxID=6186 RepID=A0A183JUU5_9TREM|nr:unnamed protein product [Schistosoma curassoni]